MKNLLFIFIVGLFGCANNQVTENYSVGNKVTSDTFPVINKSSSQPNGDAKLEIMDIDSILINNKISFITTTEKLIKHLNKPDSIVSASYECGGYFEVSKVFIYSYGKTTFETNKDTAVLQKINFSDGRFTLTTPKIILNKNTTLSEIEKNFPIAFRQSYDRKDETDNKTYRLLRLQPKQDDWDSQWVLKFDNGKLVEIEYWIPC